MPELNVLCGMADFSRQVVQPLTKHRVVEVMPSHSVSRTKVSVLDVVGVITSPANGGSALNGAEVHERRVAEALVYGKFSRGKGRIRPILGAR